jgi:hypothetical protein
MYKRSLDAKQYNERIFQARWLLNPGIYKRSIYSRRRAACFSGRARMRAVTGLGRQGLEIRGARGSGRRGVSGALRGIASRRSTAFVTRNSLNREISWRR